MQRPRCVRYRLKCSGLPIARRWRVQVGRPKSKSQWLSHGTLACPSPSPGQAVLHQHCLMRVERGNARRLMRFNCSRRHVKPKFSAVLVSLSLGSMTLRKRPPYRTDHRAVWSCADETHSIEITADCAVTNAGLSHILLKCALSRRRSRSLAAMLLQ